jgi:hypothetical protein
MKMMIIAIVLNKIKKYQKEIVIIQARIIE